ncbi:MAG: class I SAM-dependent methyltransferase, partial [Candidatus Aminicenantales bacterium]
MTDARNPSPYEAPELYDLLFDSLDFDIPYWVENAKTAGGPVLEIACGTGRILLPIRKAGVNIEGLDSSPAMIGRLKDKARAAGHGVRAEVADMREFAMGRRYSRIFCAFNGFAHCETIEDQLGCLRSSLRHLEPGGALVIHMSYPGPAYWAEPEGKAVLEHEA